MKLKQLFADDNAVSPVIGVILMVAITVILAAVIGTFVLGLGDNLQQTSPTSNFNFGYDDSGSGDVLDITHDGGQSVTGSQLSIVISGSASNDGRYAWDGDGTGSFSGNSGDVTAGDGVTVNDASVGGTDIDLSGATIKVVWTSETGENSATLSEWEGPDA